MVLEVKIVVTSGERGRFRSSKGTRIEILGRGVGGGRKGGGVTSVLFLK